MLSEGEFFTPTLRQQKEIDRMREQLKGDRHNTKKKVILLVLLHIRAATKYFHYLIILFKLQIIFVID